MYPGNKRKKLWREEKERLLKMTLEERRKEYLRDYVPLKDIPTWMEEMKNKTQSDDNTNEAFLMQKSLSEKVSLYRGDITVLEIDAIVNAEIEGRHKRISYPSLREDLVNEVNVARALGDSDHAKIFRIAVKRKKDGNIMDLGVCSMQTICQQTKTSPLSFMICWPACPANVLRRIEGTFLSEGVH
ncbi:O-acetyl-ADP-ribose deacetylase MACROD2 isoform X2 [Python bivittatus]|uniref:O-acetyl-ADP-ribose deacetylase MACROD2 isoform X2 n=1 Tax=Python bivittatus TaxID=176946 RepID=A0A9F5IQI3_PYTBI|nr:O-acetyl-ADP-ribose deacetylase MACROD2 isoform X2 [Python bivittatus]